MDSNSLVFSYYYYRLSFSFSLGIKKKEILEDNEYSCVLSNQRPFQHSIYFFITNFVMAILNKNFLNNLIAQSAGAVEYTDCTSAEGVRNQCPEYDTKQSDGEVPVMLGPWGIRSTPSLPLLPGPLWPSVVAPDRALSMS